MLILIAFVYMPIVVLLQKKTEHSLCLNFILIKSLISTKPNFHIWSFTGQQFLMKGAVHLDSNPLHPRRAP